MKITFTNTGQPKGKGGVRYETTDLTMNGRDGEQVPWVVYFPQGAAKGEVAKWKQIIEITIPDPV